MKFFICALDEINAGSGVKGKQTVCLGIPAEKTEQVIQAGRAQTAVYERENQELFISLPALLRLRNTAIVHGLVLKSTAERTVLLSPKIDVDLEIPEENIHALPGALQESYKFLRGVYFSNNNMILILDPDKLAEMP